MLTHGHDATPLKSQTWFIALIHDGAFIYAVRTGYGMLLITYYSFIGRLRATVHLANNGPPLRAPSGIDLSFALRVQFHQGETRQDKPRGGGQRRSRGTLSLTLRPRGGGDPHCRGRCSAWHMSGKGMNEITLRSPEVSLRRIPEYREADAHDSAPFILSRQSIEQSCDKKGGLLEQTVS